MVGTPRGSTGGPSKGPADCRGGDKTGPTSCLAASESKTEELLVPKARVLLNRKFINCVRNAVILKKKELVFYLF